MTPRIAAVRGVAPDPLPLSGCDTVRTADAAWRDTGLPERCYRWRSIRLVLDPGASS